MALEFELGAHDPRTVRFSDLANRTPITAGEDYTQPELDFYNSDFAKMYENNPALRYQYTPTFWDKLFRNTPFKTSEKAWIDEQRNNALNYGTELQELDRQQEYNNATNQAQRMRDAGLNPNLDPSSVSAGEASENDNATLPEQTKKATDLETTKETLNVITSALGSVNNIFVSALSMINNGTGIYKNIMEVNSDTRKKVYDIMKEVMEGHMDTTTQNSLYPFFKFGQAYVDEDAQMTKNVFMQSEWVKSMFRSKKEKEWAWNAYEDLKDNYKTVTEANKAITDTMNSGITLGQTGAKYKAWGGNYSAIKEAYSPIAEFEKQMASILAETGVDEGNYRRDYWKIASGSAKALAENAQYGYNYEYWSTKNGQTQAEGENKKAEIMSAVTGAFADMIQEYAQKASDPNRPWYEKMLYITIMKFFADLDNTNTVQMGGQMIGSMLPTTNYRY